VAEQALDVGSMFTVLRRHVVIVAAVALVGAAQGVGFTLTHPPMYSSTSMVLLPSEEGSSGPVARDVDTVTRVAGSDVVLGPVAEQRKMSVVDLRKIVDVTAPTVNVVQFDARSDEPRDAERLAKALAESEVEYLHDAASSLTSAQRAALTDRASTLETNLGTVADEIKKARARQETEPASSVQGKADASVLARLTAEQAELALQLDKVKDDLAGKQTTVSATIIQESTPARRPGAVMGSITKGAIGLVAGLLIVTTVLMLFRRKDKRLRFRDEMADAIGSPVVASTHSRVPRSVAGWTSLLTDYVPTSVDAWAFRRSLYLMADSEAESGHPDSITVISIADDPRALSLGPRLAAYCADGGLRTRLVAARGHELAAPLWAACAQASSGKEVRPGLVVDTRAGKATDDDVSIVLAVVDREAPDLRKLPRTSVAVLAVSAGTATADDLARLAVAADGSGQRIQWLYVVDPDDLDRTTGRLLQRERAHQAALPARITGVNNPTLEVVHDSTRRKKTR
jgi:capsular polysaccharide biosynthesis protein